MLCLALLLSVFAGCSKRTDDALPPSNESVATPAPPPETEQTRPVTRMEIEPPEVTHNPEESSVAEPEPAESGAESVYAAEDEEPFGEWVYSYPMLQKTPVNMEMYGGVYVLRPDKVENFFSEEDIYSSYGEIDEEFRTREYIAKNMYGFFTDFFMGCSVWCAVSGTSSAGASSALPNYGSITYNAENVISFTRDDAWCEGVDGYGIGEYVELFEMRKMDNISAEPQPYAYSALCIANGYSKTDELYYANSRPSVLKMYVDDRLAAYIELEDTPKLQYFLLYDVIATSGEDVCFRFEIAEVYPGEKYEDTCITGISFAFSGFSHH